MTRLATRPTPERALVRDERKSLQGCVLRRLFRNRIISREGYNARWMATAVASHEPAVMSSTAYAVHALVAGGGVTDGTDQSD